MAFSVHDADGHVIAGDPQLDDELKASARLVNGWITDDDGKIVYESPKRAEILAREADEVDPE